MRKLYCHQLAMISGAVLLSLAPVSCFHAEARAGSQTQRPSYEIEATIDYELLTFKGSALITVPATSADPLRNAAFYLYANAAGILDDERRRYIVVDGIWLQNEELPFKLQGPVLHVSFNRPQDRPFALRIDYHGVVPRTPNTNAGGGLLGLSGDSLGSLSRLLGSNGGQSKSGNNDFGLYAYSDGILSLGSFWYPQLAVRRNGKWIDEEPKGLGDVSYSEAGDFDVTISLPANVKVAASGGAEGPAQALANGLQRRRYSAHNVRDFAILMSEDYVQKSKTITAGHEAVTIEAYATRKNEGRLDQVLDIAGNALQIYSRRFGPYSYGTFKVAEGTIRGGAGGMEFSGLTSIAAMMYTDWNQQFTAMSGLLGNNSVGKALGGVTNGKGDETRKGQAATPQDNLGSFLSTFLGQQTEMLNSLLEMTIAHEAAHQWWAIAVGSDSVREPFVDESLANYSAILYFEDRYGRATAEKMINMHLKMPYSMARMLGTPDAAANLPTSAYDGNLQYGAVVYGKGALYYDALRRAVGDPVFFSSVREYYSKYRGSLAGPRSLLEIVQAKAPTADVDKLYQHWLVETHGDEDIGGGSLGGIQDILGPFLQLLGNLQGTAPATKP